MSSYEQRLFGTNPLITPLGPLLSDAKILKGMTCAPKPPPADVGEWPIHAKRHLLADVKAFYYAPRQGQALFHSIDVALRSNYMSRRILGPQWRGEDAAPSSASASPKASAASAIFVTGQSGTGKTAAVERCLSLYPEQVHVHEHFPGFACPHVQVVWQSLEVPSTGRLADLAIGLMQRWDDTVSQALGSDVARFKERSVTARNAFARMEEWKRHVNGHFLGVLHLDEVQNFFRLPSIQQRRSLRRRSHDAQGDLTVAEEACLRYILHLANTGSFVLVLSGTPDGVSALGRRFSNAQRFASAGFHHLELLNPQSQTTSDFVKQLCRQQYFAEALPYSDNLLRTVIAHTAGVRRLIIALWIAAHRCGFERQAGRLAIEDFDQAAATYLAPVRGAVQALQTGDPTRLQQYEDLLPRDPAFWSSLLDGSQTHTEATD